MVPTTPEERKALRLKREAEREATRLKREAAKAEAEAKKAFARQEQVRLAALNVEVTAGQHLNAAMEGSAEKVNRKLQREMAVAEQKIRANATTALQNDPDQETGRSKAIMEYHDDIVKLYYGSERVIDSLRKSGDRPLEREYLKSLDITTESIRKDLRLTPEDRDALLEAATKAKAHITSRLTVKSKLMSRASSLLKSDAALAVFAGAATKSPLIALGVMAYRGTRKNKTSQRIIDQRLNEQRLNQERRMAIGGTVSSGPTGMPSGTPTGTSTGTPPLPPAASPMTPTAAPVAATVASDGATPVADATPARPASALVSGGSGGGIGCCETLIEIAVEHTRLLQGIFDHSKLSAQYQERQLQLQALSAEESAMEDGSSLSRTATMSGSTAASRSRSRDGDSGSVIDTITDIATMGLGATALGKGLKFGKTMMRGGGNLLRRIPGVGRLATAIPTAVAVGAGAGATALNAITKNADDAGKAIAANMTKAGAGAKGLIKTAIASKVPKHVAKMFGKSIPVLGAAVGIGFAIKKLLEGDLVGAGLETVSGLAGPITAIPTTVAALAREVYGDVYGQFPERDPQLTERMNEITQGVQDAVTAEIEKMKGTAPASQPPTFQSRFFGTTNPVATPRPTPPSAVRVPRGLSAEVTSNLRRVEQTLQQQGITDPAIIRATLGNVMKESRGEAVSEGFNYRSSTNDKIKSIFGDRLKNFTDAEMAEIRKDPKKFAAAIYGPQTKIGRELGNTSADDAYNFRGRGFIQLTGRANYIAASQALFGDDRLVRNPELANNPEIAARIAAWFVGRDSKKIARDLGLDLSKPLTQQQANQYVTSNIAGRAIRANERGHLGDTLRIVNAHTANMMGDVAQSGRSTIQQGMAPSRNATPTPQPVVVVAHAGTNAVVGMGTNAAPAPIPAPVDQQPTIRTVLER